MAPLRLLVAALVAAAAFACLAPAASAEPIRPPGPDLDVTFINRSPLYNSYCIQYTGAAANQPGIPQLCPGTQNDRRWPEPGETVTFTAYVVNKGTEAAPGSEYAWYVDGQLVKWGSLPPLGPGGEISTTFKWAWAHELSPDNQAALGEHAIRFEVDPGNKIAEPFEGNNRLEDATNALSLRVTMTPEAYLAYETPAVEGAPWSAEDWLQKQVAALNSALAAAIYPATPKGAGLRFRVNTFLMAEAPPPADGLHDIARHMEEDTRVAGALYDPATDLDWGLIRELGRLGGLVDLSNATVDPASVFVRGQDGDLTHFGFGWPRPGIMGGGDTGPYNDPRRVSSHTAGGAAALAGYRSGYTGAYLYDLPALLFLRILDGGGQPAAGVSLALYQRGGPLDWTGKLGIDDVAEISGVTDVNGFFILPNRPVSGGVTTPHGRTLAPNPFGVIDVTGGQNLFLVRLRRGGHEEYRWLDITRLNLAYWSGTQERHSVTFATRLPPDPGAAPVPPAVLPPQIQGRAASLAWLPSVTPGVAGYRVYRATPPDYEYVPLGGLLSGTSLYEDFPGADGGRRVYVVTAVDAQGRESAFSRPVYAPGLGDPVAVTLAPGARWGGGEPVILDNGKDHGVLRLDPAGRYTERLGGPGYDLGAATGLAYDPAGRLVIAGFGASPRGERAIRIFSPLLEPVAAFGEAGEGPAAFTEPSGVAVWPDQCTYGGPYGNDDRSLLLLHLDGSTRGARGETAVAEGVTFTGGRHGEGVAVDGMDVLSYFASGNIEHTSGALEFWVRPEWAGDDKASHTLFWWGGGAQTFHLSKTAGGDLTFRSYYLGGDCSVTAPADNWARGEWRHVGISWAAAEIQLYLDGARAGRVTCGGVSRPNAAHFFIGSQPAGFDSAEAAFDEVRISDIPRLGNADTCGRIIATDAARATLRAFAEDGTLIATYSSPKIEGQLNRPEGLAVDGQGRIIVADSSHHRLVVFTFNGYRFEFNRRIVAGFNAPAGVGADSAGHIAVADTGNNRIVVLNPGGDVMRIFTAPNDGYPGPFNAPRGVAITPRGDLIVADTGNHRVVTVRGALYPYRLLLPGVGGRQD